MSLSPSIGDILMLSQTAWKIGRAFASGRKSAPSEFAEVQREADGLSEALKLVAETLHDDDSLLREADAQTQTAVTTILSSAAQSLGDLESFVERYQPIRKRETNGGFVVERTWSELVIANYKTFKWTTEGGDINALRSTLHVHTNTISLTMQALQSKSISRLERTVVPMAENVASIHDKVHGDLGRKIDDLHRIIMTVANSTPSLMAQDMRPISTASSSTTSTLDDEFPTTGPCMLEAPPPRSSSYSYNLPIRNPARLSPRESASSQTTTSATTVKGRSSREDSAYYSMGLLPFERENGRGIDLKFESGSPPSARSSIGDDTIAGASQPVKPIATLDSSHYTSDPMWSSSKRASKASRPESTTLPNMLTTFGDDAGEGSSRPHAAEYSPVSPYTQSKKPSYHFPSTGRIELPPPALDLDTTTGAEAGPATPSSVFESRKRDGSVSMLKRAPSQSINMRRRDSPKSPLVPPNPADQPFVRSLFSNAAILCDVRGTLVEYARTLPDEPDPRYDTEMVEICKESRICVIRKRESLDGRKKVVTSIWALSDDGEVRCQQKLSDFGEYVPYCSYFQAEKVSIPPSDGEMSMRFHGKNWGDELEKEIKSHWINYLFESEEHANQFQSAIFGRTLLGSFRTVKTTVIHEGLKGAFAFEEQFANIEMLRLWEEDGTATSGAAGGVLALMHMGSNFGEGWARWWMNSSKQQVRVKDETTKFARIKGIDVRAVKPGAGTSAADRLRSPSTAGEGLQPRSTTLAKRPERRVAGVRIEFKTEEERERFVKLAKKVQERMIPLPDT